MELQGWPGNPESYMSLESYATFIQQHQSEKTSSGITSQGNARFANKYKIKLNWSLRANIIFARDGSSNIIQSANLLHDNAKEYYFIIYHTNC